jgi:hypothetical protein
MYSFCHIFSTNFAGIGGKFLLTTSASELALGQSTGDTSCPNGVLGESMPAPYSTMRLGLVAGVLIEVGTWGIRGMVLAITLAGGISPADTLKSISTLARGLSHNYY